ncbi:MAG TPA: site-specific DNA-methyltransferase, partial [Nitrospinaceae bacterium]|nr:site-specific DNA-methyltransferase [Nitrospinaceae bacterium]
MGYELKLTENEKKKIIELIETEKPLPTVYKSKLFGSVSTEFIEATRVYKLVYKGKSPKEQIIANTPAAPLQKIKSFNSNNEFNENWSNRLIYGDNLLALKSIYEDQLSKNTYKTKNKVKLIYIDPPFSTKQDFMKDREKAYRDKLIGAEFIEFIRKRLILLRSILADNGSIYVHLDGKKVHYLKAILDEVFGEHCFLNEIIWKSATSGSSKARARSFGKDHETILVYAKNNNNYIFNKQYMGPTSEYISKEFTKKDDVGRYKTPELATYSEKKLQELKESNRLVETSGGKYRYKIYLKDFKGILVDDIWTDIPFVSSGSSERTGYPTQKPELLLDRIIRTSSNEGDIVLDAFSGSGTTCAVAEKLNRKWIGIDCGRLSIYTTQKRILSLSTQIGPKKNDGRKEHKRTMNFNDHSKNSRGLFLIYEKARNGDLNITDTFLKNLAQFIETNLAGSSEESFSLICPEAKFKVHKLKVADGENEKAGEKVVTVGRVRFLISFIQPKEKAEKEKTLKAKEFTLYNAGI